MGLVDLSRFVMDLTPARLLLMFGLVVAAQELMLLVALCVQPAPMLESRLDAHWELWKKIHGKSYPDEVEDVRSRGFWQKELMNITKHNLEVSMGLHTYDLGMNFMGNLRPEEIMRWYAWKRQSLVTSLKNEELTLASLLLVALSVQPAPMFDSRLDAHWELWKKTYRKWYPDEVEDVRRRELWEKNLMFITKNNLESWTGPQSHCLTMNHMGDLRPEELPSGDMFQFTPPDNILPKLDILQYKKQPWDFLEMIEDS